MTERSDLPSDPVVARALRDLPVPDHRLGFWDDLAGRLATEDDEGSTPVDRRVSTAELPAITVLRPEPDVAPAGRMRFLAAAAAVLFVAVAAGLALRGDGDGRGTGSGEQAATTEAATTQAAPFGDADDGPPPSPVEPPLTSLPFPLPAPTPTPEAAVLTWVQALGSGDEATAASLLGPSTLRHAGAAGAEPEGLMLELAEGYGAWAEVRDLEPSTIEIPRVGAVVVLSGTYEGEGDGDPYRLDAIPTVEVEPGRWAVEPVARPADDSETLKLVRPEPHPEGYLNGQSPDAVLEAASDSEVTFWFALDDAPAVPSDDGRWDPPGSMSSRTHRLVVVAVGDGIFVARAGTFVVEG